MEVGPLEFGGSSGRRNLERSLVRQEIVQRCPSLGCAHHMASHNSIQNNFIYAQTFCLETLGFDLAASVIHLRKRVVKGIDVKFACCNIAVLKPHLPLLEYTHALYM